MTRYQFRLQIPSPYINHEPGIFHQSQFLHEIKYELFNIRKLGALNIVTFKKIDTSENRGHKIPFSRGIDRVTALVWKPGKAQIPGFGITGHGVRSTSMAFW